MQKGRDIIAIITIILLAISGIAGIMSFDFSHSYEFVNQYGHTVKMYGYGVYAFDTYFQGPISIGTDICIVLVVIPMFLYSLLQYRKKKDQYTELKLVSVYGVVLYYAASVSLGLTYNKLFLIYVALFSCSLFGMFQHICHLQWKQAGEATKGLNVFFVISGIALMVAWLPDVIPTLLHDTTLSTIGVYTTCVTYVFDMGIISPLCFISIYLLKKKNPVGVLIQAVILKICMVVGVMMISQTICQIASGIDLPFPVLATKSISFFILGMVAFILNKNMYQRLIIMNK